MSWADIAGGRKPAMAPNAFMGGFVAVASAVPSMGQATHPSPLSTVTDGLASVSIAGPPNPRARVPGVGTNILEFQKKAGQSKNHRHRKGKKKAVTVSSRSTGVPLKQFHPFPRLPAELRLKVYRQAMTQRRLIELERGPDMSIATGIYSTQHQWFRVCPNSRTPPVLMHVCQESRDEAQKVYTLRCFDSKVAQYLPNSPELHEHYIWYNPTTDILFFGEETCVSTYIHSFSGERDDIPAIAIVNSNKGAACCDHDDPVYGVGVVDTLQALHGFDPSVTNHHHRYGGCPGLKEVFIVVKSKLWPHAQGEMDQSVTLRPATNEGLTKGQVCHKAQLENDITDVEAGIPLPGVGKNVWIGERKPTFQFVSFASVARDNDPGEPDGMTISRKDLGKLRRDDWVFVKNTEAVTGCEIFIPEEEYRGENPHEIGFWGARKNVDAAKVAIEERLALLNAERKGK